MAMKNSNSTIGIRTRNVQVCNTVPQPNAPPRAPQGKVAYYGEVFLKTAIKLRKKLVKLFKTQGKLNLIHEETAATKIL